LARRSALVVDDDPVVMESLQQLLEMLDYDVCAASTRDEALAALARRKLDIVLLDLMLPGVKDLSLLRECLAIKRLPIVLMTGYGTIPLAVDAMKEGAMDFLTKPFAPEALPVVLQKALERFALQDENRRLKSEIQQVREEQLLGRSEQMEALRRKIGVVAPVDTTVLIEGETGTGKELVARALHDASARAAGPFVAINCAALPRDLVEDTLFGHDRGAFTGATSDRPGKFEESDGGTLFLDEIGLFPLELQGKLLRVLQEKVVERLGSRRQVRVDARIIAAANQNLLDAVKGGAFREDLYFRLAAFPLAVPPLRDRGTDAEDLAQSFLGEYAEQLGRPVTGFSRRALAQIAGYPWPGNVRELRNMVERSVLMAQGARVESLDLPEGADVPAAVPPSRIRSYEEDMRAKEREYLVALLTRSHGMLEAAAQMAGLSYSTLRRKLLDHGLRKEDFRGE
jgi:DNA-binding NtrC family response regulator